MRSPAELSQQLDSYLTQLDEAGKGLDEALDLLVDAEDAWLAVYDEFLEQLSEESDGKRLPGEDVRVALCRRANSESREAWRFFRRMERAREKNEKKIMRLRTQVSGIQTELRMLKEEAGVSAPQPAWSQTS